MDRYYHQNDPRAKNSKACYSFQIPDKCCKWICLDELHPVGGINTEGDRSGGGPVINVRYTPGNGADIGLRLVSYENNTIATSDI